MLGNQISTNQPHSAFDRNSAINPSSPLPSSSSRTVPATDSYDLLMKFVIIGNSNTGKSCLLTRFTKSKFKSGSSHTIGIEFGSKMIPLRGQTIKLQIWDSAGQERFRAMTQSYWRGAAGCLLVYDISDRSSFLAIPRWLHDVRSLASSQVCLLLVGNKTDLEASRAVSQEEAERFAQQEGILYIESSALTGHFVETAFTILTENILTKISSGDIDLNAIGSGIQYGDRALERGRIPFLPQSSRSRISVPSSRSFPSSSSSSCSC